MMEPKVQWVHFEDVLRRVDLARDQGDNSGDAVSESSRRPELAGDGLSACEQKLISLARTLLRMVWNFSYSLSMRIKMLRVWK